jgi:hypothetical protein
MQNEPQDAQQGESNGRRLAFLAVKLLVSISLLYYLLRRIDAARMWNEMQHASQLWLAVALGLYLVMILVSAWRWDRLLRAQQLAIPGRTLVGSYLVATFFNNFLPSNIGGDVVRIRDTAPAAGSKTVATTIVFIDRVIGLIGLLFVAAVGASLTQSGGPGRAPVWPPLLWAGLIVCSVALAIAIVSPTAPSRLLRPIRRFHHEWVEERLGRLSGAFTQFKGRPAALFECLAGAIVVQLVLVAFYAAVAQSVGIPIPVSHLAVLVPVSFVVQMLPVSVNGFGVREATFSYYFLLLHLPLESALVLSLLGTATIFAFSVSGAVVYAARG